MPLNEQASSAQEAVILAIGARLACGVEDAGRNRVCSDPLCAAMTPVRDSFTGELRTVVVPSPSWPAAF